MSQEVTEIEPAASWEVGGGGRWNYKAVTDGRVTSGRMAKVTVTEKLSNGISLACSP